MPARRKKRAKGKDKTPDISSNADLQTPISLPDLETPTSTSSLTYSPSDLTPLVSAFANIALNSPPNRRQSSPQHARIPPSKHASVPLIPPNQAPGHPPPLMEPIPSFFTGIFISFTPPIALTVHSKLRQVTPPYNRTEAVKNFGCAYNASKKLQQLVGFQEPEPFVVPPEVPLGLEERFVLGLQDFGKGGGIPERVLVKTVLEDISEEMESPIKGAGEGLNIKPPVWKSAHQAVAGARIAATKDDDVHNQATTLSKDGLGLCATVESDNSSDTDTKDVLSDHSHHQTTTFFESSTTLADDLASRPESAKAQTVSDTRLNSASPPYVRALDYGSPYGCVSAGWSPPHHSNHFNTLPGMQRHTSPGNVSSNSGPYYRYLSVDGVRHENGPQRSGSAPIILFPSPRVGVQTCESAPADNFTLIDGYAHRMMSMQQPAYVLPEEVFGSMHQPVQPPKITIESPSPKKISHAKKRTHPSSVDEMFGPPIARSRAEDSTGLPILSADSEAMWKFRFPGNTHALLPVLLKWSWTMQSFYNPLPDNKSFPFHAAFPYPVEPPVCHRLLSVAFYDTSVEPHREIRFLGPGDAAEISYHEVDTFRSQEELDEQQKHDCKVDLLRTRLGLTTIEPQKGIRHMPMYHCAATGEGRWAYILIKGHQSATEDTAPHVMIAFHISAITNDSTCLHTVLPDNHTPVKVSPTPPHPPLKRFGSLQNLMAASRHQKHMHQTLHSASSTNLPRVKVHSSKPEEGAQTLRRTVLKLEKAGSVPLIKGYRVGVVKFRGWLYAVGKGSGKVIMWRERE